VASTNLTRPRATVGFYDEEIRDTMLNAVKISTKAIGKLQRISDKRAPGQV